MQNSLSEEIVGLDIGGANLKIASAQGRAVSMPFALWKAPERLPSALRELIAHFPTAKAFAVTMTGELCDCFATRRQGVHHILASLLEVLPSEAVRVWATSGKWLTPAEVDKMPLEVAANNWHALATWAGRLAPTGSALLLDVGSTTTDIIPIWQGKPCSLGKNDPDRLRSRELIYTGAKRTPICALLSEGVCAEWFAAAQDVYLVLGHLPEEPESTDSADNRPLTRFFALGRLAHMLGGDAETIPEEELVSLALKVFARQRSLIVDALRSVSARLPQPPERIILSGSGSFLAQAAWIDFVAGSDGEPLWPMTPIMLNELLGEEVSSAACAFAAAVLFEEDRSL